MIAVFNEVLAEDRIVGHSMFFSVNQWGVLFGDPQQCKRKGRGKKAKMCGANAVKSTLDGLISFAGTRGSEESRFKVRLFHRQMYLAPIYPNQAVNFF